MSQKNNLAIVDKLLVELSRYTLTPKGIKELKDKLDELDLAQLKHIRSLSKNLHKRLKKREKINESKISHNHDRRIG